LSGWRKRSGGIVAGVAAAVALAGCGGTRQDASEPSGDFAVDVPSATFPVTQHLASRVHLKITVVNRDQKTIPDLAVTITDGDLGTSAQAFAELSTQSGLANPSKPVWIVDRGPDPVQRPCPANFNPQTYTGPDYSACSGGPGGAVTAYSNTWAMGSVPAGESRTFDWTVTAVKAGRHVVNWQVFAGLNGKAKAQGTKTKGSFTVRVVGTPQQSYVNDAGQVVVGK
jgi:hypothetical protein